jgi:hypothetical protein
LQAAHEFGDQDPAHGFRDQDPTPRAYIDTWRPTPRPFGDHGNSIFDFSSFSGAVHGSYTPTLHGMNNTIYHRQAGDLHTPTLGILGLNTPLSPQGALQGGAQGGMLHVNPFQMLHRERPSLDTMRQMVPHEQQQQQAAPAAQPPPPSTFPPALFLHQDAGYDSMDHDMSPIGSDHSETMMTSMARALHTASPPQMVGMVPQMPSDLSLLPPGAEHLRYFAMLHATTAMVKDNEEVPVTYLNKNQSYSLTIKDRNPTASLAPGTRYRTHVRVSFDEALQRQKPATYWSLWRDNRGSAEAYQRGGKLQAVEFVSPSSHHQQSEADDKRPPRVELEAESFDSFSVIWTTGTGGAEVKLQMRFNFLSTDFSHSKGIKGAALRLCAKTALLPAESSVPSPPSTAPDTTPEVCYCKIQLFRDHGAERKLSNDVVSAKKHLHKINDKIDKANSGVKGSGKRKRSALTQGRVAKHKRTWSISSASSAGGGGGGGQFPVEEDMLAKLESAQKVFTSQRPTSVLYLRGDEQDDPDLYPVPYKALLNADAAKAARDLHSGHSSVVGASLVSPTPSSRSVASQISPYDSDAAVPRSLDQITRIGNPDANGQLTNWIDSLDVDGNYRPPSEQPAKPVACFYLQRRDTTGPMGYHRAVYLGQRTAAEFVERVAAKFGLDASRVARCVHAIQHTANGAAIEVAMDDDVVKELPEGQVMVLEVDDISDAAAADEALYSSMQAPNNREWEMDLSLDDHHLPDLTHFSGLANNDGLGRQLNATRPRPLAGGDLVFRLRF